MPLFPPSTTTVLRHFSSHTQCVTDLMTAAATTSRLCSPFRGRREDRNKIGYFVFPLLNNALRNPHQVTDLLLLQLNVRIEHTKVHLRLKSKLIHSNFALVELVVDAELIGRRAHELLEDGTVGGVRAERESQLGLVVDLGEQVRARRVQLADGRIQLLAVSLAHGGLVQGRPEGIQGDVDGSPVGAGSEQAAAGLRGLSADLLAEAVEVFKVQLHQRVLQNFDLNFLENVPHIRGGRDASGRLLEVLGEIGAHWGVHQHGLVQVGIAAGVGLERRDVAHGRFLEHTQRVALRNEVVDVSAAESPTQQQHDVLDHVLVGDEIHEGAQGLHGLRAHILELDHHLAQRSLLDQSRGDRGVHSQKLVVISLLKVQFDVLKRVALREVVVI
mmetsp:Transcript_68360/g.147506  ORF Transcript_68360/g.147506 Transcript_68360/m.147506 type:complete len:387 (-) Transcript_68360:166-1326(-)